MEFDFRSQQRKIIYLLFLLTSSINLKIRVYLAFQNKNKTSCNLM